MKRSFTLIELMLVVAIIGILASLVVPKLSGRAERARVTAAKADVEANISSALDLYEMDNGQYPASLNDLLTGSDKNPKQSGYLKKLPKDPWGREYYYKSPGDHNPDYDLACLGKDGSLGTDDDIVNWQK